MLKKDPIPDTDPATPRQRVIVALDCPLQRARELAELLKGRATWLKVGMTLYYAEGPHIVSELREKGFKVFVDLKLHDIPHQVRGAARSVTYAGADMLTVHAVGGAPMMSAALEGVDEGYSWRPDWLQGVLPTVLAITVLTSMDQEALRETGVQRTLADQVRSLASQAWETGMGGVVASPQEAPLLRELLGPEACIVTPGVRPAGTAEGDQSRIMTPRQALDGGATYLVVGRPITEAEDPVAAFEAIVEEMEL